METRKGRRVAVTTLGLLLFAITSAAVTGCDLAEIRRGNPAASKPLSDLATLPYSLGGTVLLTDADEDFDSGLPIE